MDIFNAYATDDFAEQNGRPFENGDAVFVIARSGNRRYSDMLGQLYTAHKHTLDQKDTPEQRQAATERSDKIMVEVMSKSILVGWSGNVKYKGVDFPYSQANAAVLLAIKDFRNWVDGKSSSFQNYLLEVKEADEKNFVPTSTGSSPGEVVSAT